MLLLLVIWVLLAYMGFVLGAEESSTLESERTVHELLGTGSSGKMDGKIQCWGRRKPHRGRGWDADAVEVGGPPKPALPFQSHKQTFLCTEILSVGFQASRGNPPPRLFQSPQLQGANTAGLGAPGGACKQIPPCGVSEKSV